MVIIGKRDSDRIDAGIAIIAYGVMIVLSELDVVMLGEEGGSNRKTRRDSD